MGYLDYGLSFLDDQDRRGQQKLSPSIALLEDEIHTLRKTMEQTYLLEATFCSDNIIEISRKLDVKINEYMRFKQTLVG